MSLIEIFKILLLILLIVCAVSVNLTHRLLPAVIIFMSYSTIMSIVWLLMESPDLAITEAAVGAGVTSILFFLTLRKVNENEEMGRNTDTGRKTGADNNSDSPGKAAEPGTRNRKGMIKEDRS